MIKDAHYSPMRVLLVEDDPRQAKFIIEGLQHEGNSVDHVVDGDEGLAFAMSVPYDIYIIDLMLPKKDGLSLIHDLRSKGITAPLLILSARNSVDERVRGLQSGGDDYLGKPFAFSELLARLQALHRRATGLADSEMLEISDLRFDLRRKKVFRGSSKLDLQPKELTLLEYLMRNTGRIVSKIMIIEHVWDFHFDPQTNVVEARISRLREKVDRPFDSHLIHTVRGIGYVLEDRNQEEQVNHQP